MATKRRCSQGKETGAPEADTLDFTPSLHRALVLVPLRQRPDSQGPRSEAVSASQALRGPLSSPAFPRSEGSVGEEGRQVSGRVKLPPSPTFSEVLILPSSGLMCVATQGTACMCRVSTHTPPKGVREVSDTKLGTKTDSRFRKKHPRARKEQGNSLRECRVCGDTATLGTLRP